MDFWGWEAGEMAGKGVEQQVPVQWVKF